jgi:hypothetical protein
LTAIASAIKPVGFTIANATYSTLADRSKGDRLTKAYQTKHADTRTQSTRTSQAVAKQAAAFADNPRIG